MTDGRQKKIRLNNRRTNIFILCMLAYPVLQFAIFWIGTNIGAIGLSFKKFDWDVGGYVWSGLENYKRVFHEIKNNSMFRRAITNSLWYMPVTCFISLPLSILFSYFLYKKMPLAPMFRVIFFLPSIIPVVVLAKAFTYVFDSSIGPIDHFFRYVMGVNTPPWFRDYPLSQIMIFIYCIWAGLGYNIILLSGAISRLPEELMEYGKLEGIGMSRELFTVVVPLIWPTISTTFLLGCTSVFTVMLQPLMLTNGEPNTCTIALLIYNAVNGREQNFMTAFGLVLSLIGVPLIMFIRWGLGKVLDDVEF